MKRIIWILMFVWVVSPVLQAQDAAKKYGDEISAAQLKDYLSILASDALEGRETGKRGQKMAAALISNHFDEIGLAAPVSGSHYQHFTLYQSYPAQVYLKNGDEQIANFDHMVYYGKALSDDELQLPVVFARKGTQDNFSSLQLAGKAVLFMADQGSNAFGAINLARSKGAKLVILVNTSNDDDFAKFESGMQGFIEHDDRLSLTPPQANSYDIGILYMAPSLAATIMKTSFEELKKIATSESKNTKNDPSASITFKAGGAKTVVSENVLGYLEGTDKKDELVVVTAHYDHIGKMAGDTGDLINNGADDDGSGTATVMELARVFAKARNEGHGPRRSMLFMTVAGEEKGLLGSDYYTQHPVFPLANTVVDLNIDMVGRHDPQHKDSPPYIYIIGSDKLSMDLHHLSESTNEKYTHLVFDYTYNDQNHPDRLYYRSDHWNFAKNNIPIIFYFDGIHEDYHKPSDEIGKIEFDLLRQRAQCVFYTAWTIANRDQRLVVDKDKMLPLNTGR